MLDSAISNDNKFVTTGLVDFHVHVFEHHGHPTFNLNPDSVGINSGISTVVDQGGAGAMTLSSFKHHIVDGSKTHVQCFVSAYLIGGNARGEIAEMYGPTGMNADKTIQAVRIYDPEQNFVRGVKAHCGPSNYDKWGIEPLRVATEIAQELNLPVYVHLGSLWGFPITDAPVAKIVDEVLDILRPGDILAHPYRPENGLVSPDGKIHPAMPILKQKGILVDVGRGSTVSFRNIRIMLEHGYEPDIISSDSHGFSRPGEHSLLRTMNEMLHFGMPADRIVAAVTDTPKQYLKNCPTVETHLQIVDRSICYSDSTGETITVNQAFEIV
jgi:dihydroorotase